MSVTLSNQIEDVVGSYRKITVDVTMDASYAAGGESISAASLGLVQIISGAVLSVNAAAAVLLWNWDKTNKKLIATYPTGGDQTAPTVPAAPLVVTTPDAGGVAVTGSAAKPALTGAFTPGVGKEVAATADLHSMVVSMEFCGY